MGSVMLTNNDKRLKFRGLSAYDLAILEKWYSNTDCFGYATGFKSFTDIRQRILEPLKSDVIVLMIEISEMEENSKPIGFIYGEIKQIDAKKVLWIYTIIIEPYYQQKGYGTLAINRLLQWSHIKIHTNSCFVTVSEQNWRGLSFFEKAGFVRSSELEDTLNQRGTSGVAILKRNMG